MFSVGRCKKGGHCELVHDDTLDTLLKKAQLTLEKEAQEREREREMHQKSLEQARDAARQTDFEEEKARAASQRATVEERVLARPQAAEHNGIPLEAADARELYLVRWDCRESVDLSQAVLSIEECQRVIQIADDWAEQHGGWTTKRHGAYPTTDIAVSDLEPQHRETIEGLVRERVIATHAVKRGFLPEHLWCRDLFIVRYEASKQAELRKHTDGSTLSFNVLLNPRSDFQGGGTYFTHLDDTICGSQGDVVVHDGNFEHAGAPISNGVRALLMGFLDTTDQEES